MAPRQQQDSGRPGNPDLAPYRGNEPAITKAGEAPDAPITPPVADNETPPLRENEPRRDGAPAPARAEESEKVESRMPPADEARAKLAKRMAEQRRAAEAGEADDAGAGDAGTVRDALSGRESNQDTAADAAAERARTAGDGAEDGETHVLSVNGRPVKLSNEELIAHSGMTAEEVAERPDLAKKFAGRELATVEQLERAKTPRREIPSRQDPGTRPGDASSQEDDGGTVDDPPARPSARRNTTVEAANKLIEEIQISEPKDAAPKLLEFMEGVARDAAASVMETREGGRAVKAELDANIRGWTEFLGEHPELKGKRAVAAAMSHQLDQEFAADLRNVLIKTEGMSEEEADHTLRIASVDHIREAHVNRRLEGNPHVRPVDKAMGEHVWGKIKQEFGVSGSSSSSQDPPATREQRKQALHPQPRRASPAPAVAQPATATVPNRRAIAAGMNTRTGKQSRPLSA